MARYGIQALGSTLAAGDTFATVVADTGGVALRRLKFYYFRAGFSSTPADQAGVITARRTTDEGTNTDVAPVALDFNDGASLTDAGENHSAEPTYTADSEMLALALNTKHTVTWYAPPGGEIVTPATASRGLGFELAVITSGTPDIYSTIHWDE